MRIQTLIIHVLPGMTMEASNQFLDEELHYSTIYSYEDRDIKDSC